MCRVCVVAARDFGEQEPAIWKVSFPFLSPPPLPRPPALFSPLHQNALHSLKPLHPVFFTMHNATMLFSHWLQEDFFQLPSALPVTLCMAPTQPCYLFAAPLGDVGVPLLLQPLPVVLCCK